MARWLLLLALAGCNESGLLPGDAGADLSAEVDAQPDTTAPPDGYMSAWTGECCGLTCKPGQLCRKLFDGAPLCDAIPDGGACAPGICGTCVRSPSGDVGCPVSSHAGCVDFPPSCADTPTCACLLPFVGSDPDCSQRCDDTKVVTDGILECDGI